MTKEEKLDIHGLLIVMQAVTKSIRPDGDGPMIREIRERQKKSLSNSLEYLIQKFSEELNNVTSKCSS